MTDLSLIEGIFESCGLSANDGIFVFTPTQIRFLKNLQLMKDINGAALSVGWDVSVAMQFINGRKFRKLVAFKMQDQMTEASMTASRWWQFCKGLTDGYTEKATATCSLCKWTDELTMYEVEEAKSNDLSHGYKCPTCGQLTSVEIVREPFKKTREQVVGWQEWGARKAPKIERVQHEFTSETFTFQTDDAA